MKKTVLYIGLNDKDTKTQIINTNDALLTVSDIVLRIAEGGTIQNCIGVYTHENSVKVLENSIMIILYNCSDLKAWAIISECKKALNQESILKEVTEAETYFI